MPFRLLNPFVAMLGRLDAEETLRGVAESSSPHLKPADRKKLITSLEKRTAGRKAPRKQVRGAEMVRALGAMGLPIQRKNA